MLGLSELRCVVAGGDRLGEGPCWSAREGRLYWFDIKSCRLCWFSPKDGARGVYDLPMRASAAAPRAAGGLLLATEAGLAHFDPATGAVDVVQPMTLTQGFRTNDGKIDLAGHFWWSTMDDDGGRRPGVLHRTAPNGETRAMIEGLHIANTVSVSPDGRLIYVADSRLQTIFAHETEDLTRRSEFTHTRGEAFTPDGSAVDAEGFLWNAQWGGWRVVRYRPDGAIDRVVATPVEQPTSLAFGGEGLATLFVTSAWDGLTEEQRADQPLAGGLFAFEPGVRGLALPEFAG